MPEIVTITVSMPAPMQRLVMEQVEARHFANVSEYFRDLVRRDLESRRRSASPAADVRRAMPATELARMDLARIVLSQAELRRVVPPFSSSEPISDEQVAELNRRYDVAALEVRSARSKPGSLKHERFLAAIRVLRGEGTPAQRGVWWTLAKSILPRDEEPPESEGLGGAPVRAPRAPKPDAGSARAEPPEPS